MITIHKFIRRVAALIAITNAAILSPSVFAYYEFNYTSQQLPFAYGLMEGSVDSELGGGGYTEWFSISFNSDIELSSTALTTFTMTNPIAISSANPDGGMEIKPDSNGYVVLNPDGTIANWDLNVMMFVPHITRYDEVSNTQVNLHSSGGTPAGNSDEFIYRYTVATERAYDTWAAGATLEFHNQGASATSGWTVVEKASVPEPSSVILFAAGLALIGFFRRRKYVI